MATRTRGGGITGERGSGGRRGRRRRARAAAAAALLLLPWAAALGIALAAPAAGQEASSAPAVEVPPDPERAPELPPREVIFVIDTSGSMHGASIEQAKAALVSALGRLRPIDTFNVIAFASAPRALFPGSWPALPESLAKAERWIGGLAAGGGTEMLPALAAALEPPAEGYGAAGRGAVRQVVFLTDGAVADEDELFAYLEARAGAARLFAVGIGAEPNGHLLGRAAEIGRGTFTRIDSPEQVAEWVEALTRKLESPLPVRPAGEPLSPRSVPVAIPRGSVPVGLLPAGGTPAPLLRVLGAGLLLFAAALAFVLRRGLSAPAPAR